MKFEFIGCCFRVEAEFFGAGLDRHKLKPARLHATSEVKRRLWREVRGQLTSAARPLRSVPDRV
jgi:hypothetical protein